jgi:polysaccharide export outer membrane protein
MAGIGRDGGSEVNVPLQNGDTVIVGEINSPQVTVIGEVVREGTLDIRPLSRLSEAVAKAGGFTPAAAMHQVRLVRNGEQTVFDLAALDRGEELPDDPVLQDRDLVVVPETMHRVTVLGGVTRSGNYVFKSGDRIIDAVGQAGGWIDGKAAPNRTVLVRRLEDGQLAAGQVDLLAASKHGVEKGNPELQDGDMIYIPPVSNQTLRGILQTVFSASSFIRLFVQ